MTSDPFLYDTERLQTLADEELIKQGLTYFNDNRVIALNPEEGRLLAEVEDEDGEVYWLNMLPGDEGELNFNCDCNADQKVCRHALAALYSYADQYGQNDANLGTAMDDAILERIKKGRNEVKVKLLSGNIGFGTWQATSLVSATYWKRSYQVQIRSLDQRMNYCTCPDLASNRLGTCKHIEAVLHYAKSRPEYRQLKDQASPVSFVYLAWESATRPLLRLQRAARLEAELEALCNEYFNEQDQFKGRVPDDFFRFAQQVQGREDFLLGEDATRYAQQCAEDAAQALRGREITRGILQSNGILPGIKAKLYPYQAEGVAFLASRGRALLADDMGLGKTLQAITAACWLADNAEVKRVLIVCPASLKHQWAREIEKFTGRSAEVIQGPAENRTVQYRAEALFFIINYELVLRDLALLSDQVKPDLLILDEAQRIKNWRTKLASTVKLIPSRYVFVLTGTPLENRLEDLYSLLQMVDARVLGPLWRCLLDFHVTDERGKVIGYRNLSELRRRIAPVMLRRNRSLVSDQLPDRIEVSLDIAMDDNQRGLHDSALTTAGRIAQTAKRRPLTPGEQNRLMSCLQQARMACNAAGLVDKETKGSPKLNELARLLDELCLQSDRKAVVFSQWALMTEMVESLATGMGLGCVRLHGGVPSSKRGELLERFHQDSKIQIFISTDAGGVGLNLQSASVLINLDMPWNPAVLDQRIARIHRLGQKQKVQIFLLLAENSYEQRVAQLVKGKRDLFDNVVDPNANEDVVGISKKMLETLIDDLAAAVPELTEEDKTLSDSTPLPEIELEAESLDQAEPPTVTILPDREQADEDIAIKLLIEKIQTAYCERVERILAKAGGLLVVVEHSLEQDEAQALALSTEAIPVAVIDARSFHSLQRLGKSSPLAEARTWYQAEQADQAPIHPLHAAAGQKIRAAEILLEQQCCAGILDLLASALLLKLTAVSGQTQPPATSNAAAWLYGELLPQGLVTAEQAALVLQIIAFSQCAELPDALIRQAWADARVCFGQWEG